MDNEKIIVGDADLWKEKLGNCLIKSCELSVGGNKIDQSYGEWLKRWDEITKDIVLMPLKQSKMPDKPDKPDDTNLQKIRWILVASIDEIDFNKIYTCHDDKCLESTYHINTMLDFIEENGYKIHSYTHPKINQFDIDFLCKHDDFEKEKNKFTNFSIGRFTTSLIQQIETFHNE